MIKESGLEESLLGADLVITGEGKIDVQTIYGKTPIGVAKCAKKHRIPVVALAGSLSESCESVYAHGIDALFTIVPGTVSLDLALKDARINLVRTASNVARVWQVAKKSNR